MKPIAALAAILFWGVLTMWAPERWVLSLYQAGALLLCAIAASTCKIHWHPLLACLAIPPLGGLLQIAFGVTIYGWETSNSVLNWTTNLAVFFVALQFSADSRLRDYFLELMLLFGFALSILSTIQMFTSGGKIFWLFPSGYTDFIMGPFPNRNQYAAFIEMILPLALFRGVRRPGPWRYWVMAGVMIASVVASQSRAGAALVFAEAVVIPLLAARRFVPLRTAAISVAALLALSIPFVAVVGGEGLLHRYQQRDAYAPRRTMLLSSLEMVRARPLTGFGLGTWATAYPAYAQLDDGVYTNQAHNDWAQWAVEGGLPLLAVMALFGAFLSKAAWKSVWGLGLMAVLLHCLVDYPMQQRPALAGCFFAMAGTLVAGGVRRDGLL